ELSKCFELSKILIVYGLARSQCFQSGLRNANHGAPRGVDQTCFYKVSLCPTYAICVGPLLSTREQLTEILFRQTLPVSDRLIDGTNRLLRSVSKNLENRAHEGLVIRNWHA